MGGNSSSAKPETWSTLEVQQERGVQLQGSGSASRIQEGATSWTSSGLRTGTVRTTDIGGESLRIGAVGTKDRPPGIRLISAVLLTCACIVKHFHFHKVHLLGFAEIFRNTYRYLYNFVYG